MTPAEYLSRPGLLRQELENTRRRMETMRRLAANLTAMLREVRVRTSPDPGSMQGFLAEAVDAERSLPLLEEKLRRAAEETARYISSLREDQLVRLLALRYLEGLKWNEIADLLNYSETSVFRLHRQALAQLPPPPDVPEEDGPPA